MSVLFISFLIHVLSIIGYVVSSLFLSVPFAIDTNGRGKQRISVNVEKSRHWKNGKATNIAQSYKGQEAVDSNFRPRFEVTRHIRYNL